MLTSRQCKVLVCVAVAASFAPDARAAAARPSGKTWTNPKDGSEMVLVPAGSFKMGEGDEAHDVSLDSFYIGKYEVTNRQFKNFVDANPQWRKGRVDSKYARGPYLNDWEGDTYPSDKADHPVVCVSWFAAKAYCEWAGGRLPTEAEWEKAARGTDGRTYPWGSEWDRTKCNSVSYWAGRDLPDFDAWKKWWEAGGKDKAKTMKVGSFPAGASPYGLMDMAGNVWEWCSSLYKSYPYNATDGREDMNEPGSARVLRGGSWYIIGVFCRSAFRSGKFRPTFCKRDSGFRVASSATAPR